MRYYQQFDILIRDMLSSDPGIITAEEITQGWNVTEDKYQLRFSDATGGKSVALVSEYGGNVAGYINLYWNASGGAFANQNIPEIVDFGVLEKYRNHGIGRALMDVAEGLAAQRSDRVYLGVGLHSGYGAAQRIYVKRGYIPDGSGVWYQDRVCEPYSQCTNDDDLVLYFTKKLH